MDFITGIIPLILIIGLIFIVSKVFSKKSHVRLSEESVEPKESGEWDNKFQDLADIEENKRREYIEHLQSRDRMTLEMRETIVPRIEKVVFPFARSIKWGISWGDIQGNEQIWRCSIENGSIIICISILVGDARKDCINITGSRYFTNSIRGWEYYYEFSFRKEEFSEELLAIKLRECYMEICKHTD